MFPSLPDNELIFTCSEIGVLRKYHTIQKVMITGQDKEVDSSYGLLNGPLQLFFSNTVIKLLLGQKLTVLLLIYLIFYFRGCH